MPPPATRQIRAVFTADTVRVYQAYSDPIADAAIQAGRFIPPSFKMGRTTWIKPSFLWMMYRSGWGTKPGQERILGIDVSREGFEWALRHSCLTHFDPNIHPSLEHWTRLARHLDVRIQWDPERDIHLNRLQSRTIQIGLAGRAVDLYVNTWIRRIEDLTSRCRAMKTMLDRGCVSDAERLVPVESGMPISAEACAAIGIGPPVG